MMMKTQGDQDGRGEEVAGHSQVVQDQVCRGDPQQLGVPGFPIGASAAALGFIQSSRHLHPRAGADVLLDGTAFNSNAPVVVAALTTASFFVPTHPGYRCTTNLTNPRLVSRAKQVIREIRLRHRAYHVLLNRHS